VTLFQNDSFLQHFKILNRPLFHLLKCIFIVVVSLRFSPDIASKRGLTTAEMTAVEAIHRAVEFNPHVPKVRMFSLWIETLIISMFLLCYEFVYFVTLYIQN
jgi:hypothetical protein